MWMVFSLERGRRREPACNKTKSVGEGNGECRDKSESEKKAKRERRKCERVEVVAGNDGFLRGEREREVGKKQRKRAQESGNRKIGRGVGRERWREEEMPEDEVVTLV